AAENHQRLVRLYITNGVRVVDDGNLFGALPWFAEAQRLDEGNAAREPMHRMRFAAVLRQCPRLTQIWFHDKPVTDAEFSPDGRRVVTATGGKGGEAGVWDAATGQPLTPPLRHRREVSNVAFSPDGRRILTSSWDGTARQWDATTGRPLTPALQHRSWL